MTKQFFIKEPYDENMWWEDDRTFCVRDSNDIIHKFAGYYLKSIKYNFGNDSTDENITLVGSNKKY